MSVLMIVHFVGSSRFIKLSHLEVLDNNH